MPTKTIEKEAEVEAKMICNSCGCEVADGDHFDFEGEIYCQDCKADEFFYCDDCGEYHRNEDTTSYSTSNGDIICQDCYDDHYFSCQNCDEISHNNNAYSNNDLTEDWYCESCWYDLVSHCDNCDSDYWSEEGHDCENCQDENLCRDFTQVLNTKKDTFGVEIEVEGGDRQDLWDNLNENCGIGNDGSLENGCEITTPPLNYNQAVKMIKEICPVIKKAGYEATSRCGLHIHTKIAIPEHRFLRRGKRIKAEKVETETYLNVIRVVKAFEPIIYSTLPSSRLLGNWSRPICKREDFNLKKEALFFKNFKSKKDFLKAGGRYFGLNYEALEKYNTIEFRYHSGTCEADKINNWLTFIAGMTDFAKQLTIAKLMGDKIYYTQLLSDLRKIETTPYGFAKLKTGLRLLNYRTNYSISESYFMARYRKFFREHKNINYWK